MGITSCFLSVLVSMGLCSLVGLEYGPMHSIIPCLLVGLGVDDMFVIVQALQNTEADDKGKHVMYSRVVIQKQWETCTVMTKVSD